MIPFTAERPKATFERFARSWFALLARGDYAQSAQALDEPNRYGELWSAERIAQVIARFAAPSLVLCDPASMPRDKHQSLVAFADRSGYSFDHAVPFDGQWSDLSVQFEFYRREGGFAVVLHDIHVL